MMLEGIPEKQFLEIGLRMINQDPKTKMYSYEEYKLFHKKDKETGRVAPAYSIENEYTGCKPYIRTGSIDTFQYFVEETDYIIEEGELKKYQNALGKKNVPGKNEWALNIVIKEGECYSFAGVMYDENGNKTSMFDDLYSLFSLLKTSSKFTPDPMTREKKWIQKAFDLAFRAYSKIEDGKGLEKLFNDLHRNMKLYKDSYASQAAGYLRDIVMDTDVTIKNIAVSFPDTITYPVSLLNNENNLSHEEYIKSLCDNEIACELGMYKVYDLGIRNAREVDLVKEIDSSILKKQIDIEKDYNILKQQFQKYLYAKQKKERLKEKALQKQGKTNTAGSGEQPKAKKYGKKPAANHS